jgi:prevent-host-death family protein
MSHPEPTTETITAAAAREQWDEIIDRVKTREARFLVERDGKPVAALISAHELEILERYQREREEDFKALDRMRAAFADVPDDEIEQEIEKALANVRAQRRRATVAAGD